MSAVPAPSPSTERSSTRERSVPEDASRRPDREETSGRIRVYVVDDHPPIRKAVTNALGSTIDLTVCGHAASVQEAASQLREHTPDVIVLDLSLPNGHGLELVEWIQGRTAGPKIVVLSMHDETVYAERALRAGASGYLMKTEPLEALIRAVRRVERGETCLSPRMSARVLDRAHGTSGPSFPVDELTDRERQVFELLGGGRSVAEIQEELGLSRKTIETYRRRAKEKLGCETIPHLLQRAVQWTYAPEAEPPPEA